MTLTTVNPQMLDNGPAFSAYSNANQTIAENTWTKVNINTELFDTASAFNTSTYRFQPAVSGYYQVSGGTRQFTPGAFSYTFVGIWKNGGSLFETTGAIYLSSYSVLTLSNLVYLNGSTDYVELYAFASASNTRNVEGNATQTTFSAAMVRAA